MGKNLSNLSEYLSSIFSHLLANWKINWHQNIVCLTAVSFFCSFDIRQGESGRHWRDNRTVGDRAYFKFFETGMRSETGAPVIQSYLHIEDLRIEDRGVFRCRVDFREAPTRNTRIKLGLIGKIGKKPFISIFKWQWLLSNLLFSSEKAFFYLWIGTSR